MWGKMAKNQGNNFPGFREMFRYHADWGDRSIAKKRIPFPTRIASI